MAEWLKAHDSKSCDGANPFGGSNPLSSATAPEAVFFRIRISLLLDANPLSSATTLEAVFLFFLFLEEIKNVGMSAKAIFIGDWVLKKKGL